MTQLVINLSRVTQQVGIIDGQGRKTSFRLMARGRVETSYEIDPNWLAHNPGVVKVAQIAKPVDTTETPASIASDTKVAKKSATEPVVTSIAAESTTAEGA